MRHKRIVNFVDVIDEIPDGAKYLFSRPNTIPGEETEEQKAQRIITGTIEENPGHVIYSHYYEVSEEDFQVLADSRWIHETPLERIERFNKKYGPKVK